MSSYSYGIATDNDSSNNPIFDGTNWEDFANDYRFLVAGKGAEVPENLIALSARLIQSVSLQKTPSKLLLFFPQHKNSLASKMAICLSKDKISSLSFRRGLKTVL